LSSLSVDAGVRVAAADTNICLVLGYAKFLVEALYNIISGV